MNKKETTQEHINKIIEFRQAIYTNGFGKERDALSEALDALCITGSLSSFPMLSLSKGFQRQWHSLYKAVGRGEVKDEWISQSLSRRIPQEGIQHYALDGTAWPRPSARTLDDRQYVYHPTPAINGGSVCVGYPYSLLDWVPEADQSWSLSVSVKRIPSQMTSSEMGVSQIKALSENRADLNDALDIVAADAKYGHARFLRPLQEQNCAIVVKVRQDRVLYQKPEEPKKRKRGRPRVHGERFAFKEPETWGIPDETTTLEDDKFGKVKLERWKNLHGKLDADVPMDLIRASIHLEKDKPPKAIWLAWQAPTIMPKDLKIDAIIIWQGKKIWDLGKEKDFHFCVLAIEDNSFRRLFANRYLLDSIYTYLCYLKDLVPQSTILGSQISITQRRDSRSFPPGLQRYSEYGISL